MNNLGDTMQQELKNVPLNVNGKDIIAELAIMPQGAMVAIRPICEAIGVALHRQAEKISNDQRFSWKHMLSTGSDGKKYQMFCLPVEQIGPWLYSINSNKVKLEVREELLKFQLHLTKELNNVIMGHMSLNETIALRQQVSELSLQLSKLTEIVFTAKHN